MTSNPKLDSNATALLREQGYFTRPQYQERAGFSLPIVIRLCWPKRTSVQVLTKVEVKPLVSECIESRTGVDSCYSIKSLSSKCRQ